MNTMDKQFSTSSPCYEIKVATTNDLPRVLEVMRQNFHFEETMFNALCSHSKITQDERKIIETILDGSVEVAFNSSPCLVAIHNESNKIVGLNLTTLSKNPKFHETSNGDSNFFVSHNTESKLVNQYFEYLSEFNEKANLFVEYPNAKTILEFYAIAVDKNHRNMGISGDLIKAGVALAQSIEGISLVFGVFTSLFSMKSAKKIGMHTLLEIDLLDYKSAEGDLIFADTKPHNIVFVMVLQLLK